MTNKSISRNLTKKTNEWLESITDEKLRKSVSKHIIVTGGAIASMYLNEDVNDYDIYISDKQVLINLAQYYCDQFNADTGKQAWVLDGEDVFMWKSGHRQLSDFAHGYADIAYSTDMEWDSTDRTHGPSGMLLNIEPDQVKIMVNSDGVAANDQTADDVDYDVEEYVEQTNTADKPKQKYRPIFISSNAITLSDKIQLVIRFHGSPEVIHSNYDFVHCTGYWHSADNKVVADADVLEALLNKRLVYRGSKYPIASMIRTRKFIKRGYHINAGQYLKMAMQISKLDLTNIYVLEDQLTEVDSIYFMQFIAQVRTKIESGKSIDLTGDYVTSVIDKIFD